MPDHSTLSGTALHEDKRIKQSARAASTANVTLSSPGATMDGVTLVNGDRVLLKDQTNQPDNGIYVWSGATSALVRATDANTATLLFHGFKVFVREGTTNATSYWTFTTTATITLGTTALTFSHDGAGTGSVTSVGLSMPSDFSVAGSPITSTGTLAVTATNQSANVVKAGPSSGAAAAPSYRALVPADLPTMVASGASHAGGAVPDPGSTAGSTKYLREDATWAVPAGASGTSSLGLVAIQTQTPSAVSSVTFTVPSGFTNLRLTMQGRSTATATAVDVRLQFNSDTGANYNRQFWGVSGTTVGDNASTGQTAGACGQLSAASALANVASEVVVDIANYLGTTFFKNWLGRTIGVFGATASAIEEDLHSGYWASTSAISSITVSLSSGNFVTGSTITLWAESDASAQSSSAPAVASSGTISTAGLAVSRVAPAGAVTGVILQAGSYPGQMVWVVNESVAANTITFAASGTSNVADGTSDVINGLTGRRFVWDSVTSLWYRAA